MIELDVETPDGRTLHAYDTGTGDQVVVWHHGTPNIGAPPEPLFGVSAALRVRWVGYDRAGYGGSTTRPGRDVASAAADVAAVVDALGIERFAVMGHSGGGPHALACAALLTERVTAAVVVAGLAPYEASGLDWFAGMGPTGEATLRAAAEGRETKEAFEASGAGDEPDFTAADSAALAGDWKWFIQVVGPALANGPVPLIDDDLAYVAPWGCDPATITAPVLLVHGADDRVVPIGHAEWLAATIPGAELWRRDGDGHISVLSAAPDALRWLAQHEPQSPH